MEGDTYGKCDGDDGSLNKPRVSTVDNPMRTFKKYLCLLALALVAGCGLRFHGGFAMTDTNYFAEPPCIVARAGGYHLHWRYGAMGFYFIPSSKVVNGELLFSLQATSSTGHAPGREAELPITDPKRIHALETGGAFWLDDEGHKTRLEVKR